MFGSASTADDVLDGRNLNGKRVVVTGISAGIGIETARSLAAHGAHVIGTARDLGKAVSATETVRAAAAEGGSGFELVELDLASLDSARSAADDIIGRGQPLDLIIANAGVMACPFGRTADGFETQFGTNHLGHFLFVNRLAPLLRRDGRAIILGSSGHRYADVDLDDPHFDRTPYEPRIAYGRSKTANILFAVELDRRHRHRGVRAAAVHPGAIQTELSRHDPEGMRTQVDRINAARAAEGQPPFTFKTIPQGAATSLWAAVTADADRIGGRYCEDCHVSDIAGSDATAISQGVRPYAVDPARAAALWALSEQCVGERFPEP